MMKIIAVDPDSPLFGYVRPGYSIKSVNGNRVLDSIDFRFKTTDERLNLKFTDTKGIELDYQFNEIYPGDLGLTLDDGKIRVCKNDCIFCFITQQPQGMRRILYIKDEDYRLSFTHGNFVTLSNTTEEDLERIIEQRLSPIYVSVHATDDKLRRCMLRNEKLAPIIPRLKYLSENGITVHTQVVLCPGINDGIYLEKTIDQLSELYPGVETLAVVPVGLTKYRENLPNLRNYYPTEATDIIKYIEKRQKDFLKAKGSRFVWVADEFYVEAKMNFPARHTYEEMLQFENGIGMAREFISMFNHRKQYLKKIKSNKRVMFLTGYSAYPFFNSEIISFIKNELNLNLTVNPVTNHFWGPMVTVSGLLTGQDLLREARKNIEKYDCLVIPPNCLNNDNLFLDNLSLEQFKNTLGKEVIVGQYNLAETIKEVFV
jgi:putative radical SAM enzyme (TIGR03279 family)